MTSTQTKTLYSSLVLAGILFGALWYNSTEPTSKSQDINANSELTALPNEHDHVTTDDSNHQVGDIDTSALGSAIPEGKVALLDEILKSGNDNDKRLDTELKNLDPETKEALRDYYRSLKKENRNAMGTTVFLLGRNIKDEKDIAFMGEVVGEKPCLSLQDCDFAHPEEHTENDNHDTSEPVTLVYPQLVALIALQNTAKNPELKKKYSKDVVEILKDATENPSPKVRKMASRILEKYSK